MNYQAFSSIIFKKSSGEITGMGELGKSAILRVMIITLFTVIVQFFFIFKIIR